MGISIHAPRVGSDVYLVDRVIPMLFQSTLPVWGATKDRKGLEKVVKFQSTLPVWGATQPMQSRALRLLFQSTLPVWGATTVKLTGDTSSK